MTFFTEVKDAKLSPSKRAHSFTFSLTPILILLPGNAIANSFIKNQTFIMIQFRKAFFPFFLVLFSFFFFLGGYGLLDNNEGLYAQIAREMLLSGDYLLPRLNGVLYIEKPPLLYWLTALCFKVFGVTEFAARFIPAASGLGALLFVAHFLKKQGLPRAALMSFFLLGTSLGYIAFSRTLIFDVLFTACLTSSLLFLFWFLEKRTLQKALLFYLFLALAVMAKGLVALVLTGLIWVVYFSLRRFQKRQSEPHLSFWSPLHPAGLFLFVVIITPWHLMASLKEPSFAWFYFINEHLYRFLGIREPHDYYGGPFYYYTYRLVIYFMPWVFLVPFMIPKWLKKSASKKSQNTPLLLSSSPLSAFLGSWFLAIFLFFSLSKAKANYYLVTVMPPLGMLIALALDRLRSSSFHRQAFWLGQGLLAFLTGALFLTVALHKRDILALLPPNVLESLWISGGLGGSLLVFSLLYRRSGGVLWPYLPLGLISCFFLIAASFLSPIYENTFSQKQAMTHALQRLGEDEASLPQPLALYRDYESVSSLGFYSPTPLIIVDSLSQDLLFGQKMDKGAGKYFQSHTQFRKQGGYIFVRQNHQESFLSRFPQAQKIWPLPLSETFHEKSLFLVRGKVAFYYVPREALSLSARTYFTFGERDGSAPLF